MNVTDKIEKIVLSITFITMAIFTVFWLSGEILFAGLTYEQQKLFQTILLMVGSAIAGIFSIYLGIMYKFSTSSGKIWLFIGIGMLCWTIGDFIYTYYDIYTEEAPFPSIADFFYLIAYVPLALGLLLQTKVLGIKLSIFEKVLILIVFVAVSIFVLWLTLFYPIQLWYEGAPIPPEDMFGIVIGALYPILDLVLLICVLIVFVKLRHGEINIAWILLLIGILSIIIADIIFNYKENVLGEEFALTWELYDLLFVIGYLFIFASAIRIIGLMSGTFETKET